MTVFDAIYRTNAWNGVESRSGPGSGPAATRNVAPAVAALAVALEVRSVLDVACGDGSWMPDLPGYLGVDVSREAVRLARERHPHRRYRLADMRTTGLGTFDLVIVRDVLQHLSLADGLAMLEAVRRTGSTWLLASTYAGGANVDIVTGQDAYEPDLAVPPFGLGEPDSVIVDGWDYATPDVIRDPRKLLGLWRL